MKRTQRHIALAVGMSLACLAAWLAGSPVTALDRLSLLTAWLCLLLLAAALVVGPLNVRRGGQPLLNHLLRRDLGIWAALTGLLHLVAATEVVMTPAYFRTWITGPPEDPLPGWAGWIGTAFILAGYAIGVLLIRLLAISNDRALRRLGKERWKRIQRRAYWVFGLTVAHGAVFQIIEHRYGGWLLALLAVSAAVVWLQLAAHRKVNESARPAP